MQSLAILVVDDHYQSYSQGSLVPTWNEVMKQEIDGHGKLFFITIPHFDAPVDEVTQALTASAKNVGVEVEGLLIGKEPHESGDKHTHVLLKTRSSCRLSTDHLWAELGASGNIQRVVDEDRVRAYILKAYKEGSKDFHASGCYVLPEDGDKHSFNDILDSLIHQVLTTRTNPFEFLSDKSKAVRLTAFRNRKALEQLWYDVSRLNAVPRVEFKLPSKPKGKKFQVIWEWVQKLSTGELRNPRNPSRHLFLSGKTGTRKSSLGSFLTRSFNTFHFDVNDEYYDGYTDGKDLAICDEFHIGKPGRGKDLPNLNRFLEGATGQLLNVKYQKACKCDVTLPCLFISNLTKERLIEQALQHFDREIVNAFLRRFTFVDIGADPLPPDFTVVGKDNSGTTNTGTQTDGEYFPPFLFSSPIYYEHISMSHYLAIPWNGEEDILNCCKVDPDFRIPGNLSSYDYLLVSKNKQAKNSFTNPFNASKSLVLETRSIIKTVTFGMFSTETIGNYAAYTPDDQPNDKETNCTLFPPVHTLTIGLIHTRPTKPVSSWIETITFHLKITQEGHTHILFPPYFLLYDVQNTTESTERAIHYKTRSLGTAMKQFREGLGKYFMLVEETKDCSICQETTSHIGVVLSCSHLFHMDCFVKLLHSQFSACPLCKTPLELLTECQQIYVTSKQTCTNRDCFSCNNIWNTEQTVVGCVCEHCIQDRRTTATLFNNLKTG